MYKANIEKNISQGDVFVDFPIPILNFQATFQTNLKVDILYGTVILLTYDCEFDKPLCKIVLIAQVLPLSNVAEGSQGNIKHYKVWNTFYLQESSDRLQESYVDFRFIVPVPKSWLEDASNNGKRLLSMEEDSRLALQEQFSLFFGLDRDRQVRQS